MPAARRYKQSLVDELKEAVRALPPGERPEPEHSTQEALEQLREDLRRKIHDEHVDVATIVNMLNARGFKVKEREVRSAAQPKPKKQRQVAPAKGSGKRTGGGDTSKDAAKPSPGSGSFEVRPDEDDT